ncbi:MAG: type I DNA topoisomerase [Chloroflexota bacterium]
MSKTLIIVESPTKAKTIGQYLGRDYTVKASMGHVRDLPKSELGVNTETFEPKYVSSGRPQVLKDLRAAAAAADTVLLATDPDREGEAIAWHIAELLKLKRPQRLEFHEITRPAIQHALETPQPLNQALFDAQQARRLLDRLVGYGLSPLLWRKVQSGISAGRVQSVAVRLICEREREVTIFRPVEYWSIDADLRKLVAPLDPFRARLVQVDGKKPELGNAEQSQRIVDGLRQADYTVKDVAAKPVRRNPPPPFTTSTLQQAAAHRLGMSAKRTMAVAQQLYEGVDLGIEGQVGLITYMRTDSVNLAESAIAAARRYIQAAFSPQHLPEKPVRYRTRSKGAQEAHEAIRPTDPERAPESVRGRLDGDQFRLYQLIWQRMVASQMTPAVYNRTTADIGGSVAGVERYGLRATATQLSMPGYLALYGINADEQAEEPREEGTEGQNPALPPLAAREALALVELFPEQHFTEPPPRYNEASLVRMLEQLGIGRPSTYAQILGTIQDRGYVEKQGKTLQPTLLGFATNDFLVEHFGNVVDTGFTAGLEEQLDDVAAGDRPWRQLLAEFYGPFSTNLTDKQNVPHVKIEKPPVVEVGENCPDCGKPLVERRSRFGTFVGCSGYPECRYIKRTGGEATALPPEPTGVACPRCGKGELMKRVATKGRNQGNAFYGCSKYPRCRFITNDLNNLSDDKTAAKAKPAAAAPAAKARATTRTRKTVAAEPSGAAEALAAPSQPIRARHKTAAPAADGTVSSNGRAAPRSRKARSAGAPDAVWAAAIEADGG